MASVANTIVMTFGIPVIKGVVTGNVLSVEIWNIFQHFSFWFVFGVQVFLFLFTAAGLMLLLAIAAVTFPTAIGARWAQFLFVIAGGFLGYLLFGLAMGGSMVMSIFGAIAALIFVFMCSECFEQWDQATLAEPNS